MNYHDDAWIMNKLQYHYEEALKLYPENRIVGIFLQGSQNYGMDTETSDVDTKLVIIPSFKDLVFNKKPESYTHILENNEHLDVKDARLMLQLFKKQNINIVEILFTPYYILNKDYASIWNILRNNRELIALSNPAATAKTAYGMALEKYHALKHEYPSKVEVIKTFGYDPKQLYNMYRLNNFLRKYTEGYSYADCIFEKDAGELKKIKAGYLPLEKAEEEANRLIAEIKQQTDTLCARHCNKDALEIANSLIDAVQYDILKRGIL